MELLRNTRLKIGNSLLAKKVARLKRKVFYANIGEVNYWNRMGYCEN